LLFYTFIEFLDMCGRDLACRGSEAAFYVSSFAKHLSGVEKATGGYIFVDHLRKSEKTLGETAIRNNFERCNDGIGSFTR